MSSGPVHKDLIFDAVTQKFVKPKGPAPDAFYHRMIYVVEGQIQHGYVKGFARQIDNKGSCKVGFWNPVDAKDAS